MVLTLVALLFGWSTSQAAQERVFSGPQAGEKATPFKVSTWTGSSESKVQEILPAGDPRPTTLVFLHGIERSLVPLLTAIDEYGQSKRDVLSTEVILLAGDRLSGEQRLRAAANSIKLAARPGVSVEGAEGPGNYGLNKDCLMTVVVVRSNRVTGNFALVQPGIADAPAVLSAIASACDDPAPPTADALRQRRQARLGTGEPGMRGRARGKDDAAKDGSAPKEPFPGAPPTDDQLLGLLRQYIRPTNDQARVDQLISEVDRYIVTDPSLRQQAIDGWTRILHFGDRYGTPYARELGKKALDRWKQAPAPATPPR